MSKEVKETLKFSGYVLEDRSSDIPEIKGVYCAYAASYNPQERKWVGKDIVYFGKSEEGDGNIRARVNAHKQSDDAARRTLEDGEKLLYTYAATDNADVCERALVAAHSHLPRLANTQLTNGYVGPKISLTMMGACYGIRPQINFEAKKEDEF